MKLANLVAIACITMVLGYAGSLHGQEAETVSEVLQDRSIDWKNPASRAQAVQRMKNIEVRQLNKARQIAQKRGKPLREKFPNGKVRELIGLDENGELLYVETKNVKAAISTGADQLHIAPFSLDGSGLIVGVWDADSALVTHQEFNEGGTSRINNKNNEPSDDHATHVAGTVAAAGVDANAKGMVFAATIDSYDWTFDESEMAAAGATGPNQFDTKMYLSNHSYGFSYGWKGSEWLGDGTDQNAVDENFGKYRGKPSRLDDIAYDAPYYLFFWAAGNENTDGRNNGQNAYIPGIEVPKADEDEDDPEKDNIVIYNSAIHPPRDGEYRDGFETIGDHGVAKNLVTVGAVNDAVTSDQRDPSKATKANFSSTGPVDDGRIKPDLVGNGIGLRSPVDSSDTAYGNKSGTSMASPNLTGSAALLVAQYRHLTSGGAMRSSTLKGLLIHTATDIGNPGPDYKFGWGLVDVKTAAEHVSDALAFPEKQGLVEDEVTTATTTKTYDFVWDGSSEIRATLCWTDPAGSVDSAHDNRTPDLVNDLNLKLIAPDGTEYFPFIMPFVGTWTVASMSQNATTGINNTDNVEQVLIDSPGQAGAWQAVISVTGSLTNGVQQYGLLISGSDTAGVLTFGTDEFAISEDGNTAFIPVTRVGGTIGAVSVDYATANGSAVAGSDYTAASGTLSWADGEGGVKTVDIPIINDGVSESSEETLTLTLSNPVGIDISGTNPVTLVILDDEPLMRVTAPDGGETLFTNTTFNITWSSTLGGNVSIDLFKGGSFEQTIVSDTANDGLFEWEVPALMEDGSDYRVRITSLTGGGETDLSDADLTIIIEPLGLAVDASQLSWTTSGNGDWFNQNFTTNDGVDAAQSGGVVDNQTSSMQTTLPQAGTMTFFWKVSSEFGFDFLRFFINDVEQTGSLGKISGEVDWVQKTVDIPAADTTVRWTYTKDSSVSKGTDAGWVDQVVFIPDSGTPAFSGTSYQIAEDGGSAAITVNRINGSTGAISVDYATSDGSAVAVTDYTASTGTLSWADGDSAPQTFNVAITNNSTHGPPLKTLNLTLLNSVGTSLLPENSQATLTIIDDDNEVPVVNAGSDQTVSLTGEAWSPGDLSPDLWLDADDASTITLNGSTVSQWSDKSGNDRHATQASTDFQPTLTSAGMNGKDVITFDAATDYFEVDLDFMAGVDHSVFVVTKTTIYSNIYGAANGSSGANSLHVGFLSSTNYRMNYWSNDWNGTVSSNFQSGSPNLLNFVWLSGIDKEIFANGKSEGTSGFAGVIETMSGGGRIGKVVTHPHYGGDIAEFIAFTGPLSLEDRQSMEGFLAHKWGTTSLLAADHPFKSESPNSFAASANLTAAASDGDSDPLSILWSLVTGPSAVTFADPNALNTSVTLAAAGTYTLRLTVDDGFGPVTSDVVITVSDTAGFTLSKSTSTVDENGGSDTFTVVLDSQPASDVVFDVTSSDTNEATVSPASLAFTSANWNTPQTVTITGVNDDVTADDTATVTVSVNDGSSADSYDPLADQTVAVTCTDDDVPGIFLGAISGDTSEGGATATFTVVLTTQPTADVTIGLSSSDISEGTVSPASLTFTNINWNTPQVVTVSGLDDDIVDGNRPYTVDTAPATSLDSAYNEIDPEDVSVTNLDDTFTLSIVVGSGGDATGGGEVEPTAGPHAITATAFAGYAFVNWTVTQGSATLGDETSASTTVTASSNVTLQASFALNTYTVTYDGNGNDGGDVPVDSNSYAENDTVTVLGNTASLFKNGYNFTGWNTAADGSGTAYVADAPFDITADTTLYAQWTINNDFSDYADYAAENGGSTTDPTADDNNNVIKDGVEYAFYGALGEGEHTDTVAKLAQILSGALEDDQGTPDNVSDDRIKYHVLMPETPPADVIYRIYASSVAPGDTGKTLLATFSGGIWTLESRATMETGSGSEDVIIDPESPASSTRRFVWLELEITGL